MKKICYLVGIIFMILFIGCNKKEENSKELTELNFWTFQELHVGFMEKMVEQWNAKHQDKKIKLIPTVMPYEDLHNKLSIVLQSGEGAPDLVDIEINRYPNFLKGEIGLLPLNSIIDPEKDNIIKSRLDIY